MSTSSPSLPRLRCRAGLPSAAPAADLFLREHTDQSVLDAIAVVAVTPAVSGAVCIELLDGASRWCVHVMSRPGRERLTSCAGSGTYAPPATFELVSVGRLA